MELIVVNVSGKFKRVVKDGIKYLIAPITMIVPGVLNGSQGQLYYPPDEVQKVVDAWNGINLTYGHPEDKAKDNIEIINKYGLGVVRNAKWDGSKLIAEAWFDEVKTSVIDNSIIANIEQQNKIELSTGLGVTVEKTTGTFGDRTYTGIARNYKPDHLAILVSTKGACSVEDGCGVNNEAVENELSHDDIRGRLRDLLNSEANPTTMFGNSDVVSPRKYFYIVEVYDSEFIYEDGPKYIKRKYFRSGDDITLSSPENNVEVYRKTVWEPSVTQPTKTVENECSNKDKPCEDCKSGKPCPCKSKGESKGESKVANKKLTSSALLLSRMIRNGGPGSGNFGHGGCPGHQGGSCGTGGSSKGSSKPKRPTNPSPSGRVPGKTKKKGMYETLAGMDDQDRKTDPKPKAKKSSLSDHYKKQQAEIEDAIASGDHSKIKELTDAEKKADKETSALDKAMAKKKSKIWMNKIVEIDGKRGAVVKTYPDGSADVALMGGGSLSKVSGDKLIGAKDVYPEEHDDTLKPDKAGAKIHENKKPLKKKVSSKGNYWEKLQRPGYQKINPKRLYGTHEIKHSSASRWYVFDHDSKQVVGHGLGSQEKATELAKKLSGKRKPAK